MIAARCLKLIACDINENDISFAKQMNSGVLNLTYRIEDALNLSFPDGSFQLITSEWIQPCFGIGLNNTGWKYWKKKTSAATSSPCSKCIGQA
ncbi:MAG: class I SAM-dependent methyltransferase [Saprospiraceae bacterium]|nr:class I SAM-dependent methyltransferase [Saprospiraceae bacterium]